MTVTPGPPRGHRSLGAPITAAAAGAGLVTALVASLGMSASMTLALLWRSALAVILAGVVGAFLLFASRRRSVTSQVVVVALTSVGAVAITYGTTTLSMYTTGHDFKVLLVVLVGAAAAGVVTALLLGRRVAAASAAVGRATRRIAEGEDPLAVKAPEAGEVSALVNELDEMSAKLSAARAHEVALEASRRELVAWVSHDLRTPLAGIQVIAEALADGIVDDEQTVARYLRTLRREVERLAGLVNDLFELSRIQAGALALEMEKASLADLVSDAVAAADPLAAAKGVRLRGQNVQAVPDLVLSTPEVARVLRNLLENAIRHTPSDGSVWISAGTDGDDAYVRVSDACGGIREADLDRVFDMAFRGEAARTPGAQDGAGLGLAIAKGLVEAHHGEIEVANTNAGCCFTVRLPLDQSRVS